MLKLIITNSVAKTYLETFYHIFFLLIKFFSNLRASENYCEVMSYTTFTLSI